MRLVWVTNIPTPYRAPLWEALFRLRPGLRVYCLARTEPNRDWEVALPRYVQVLPKSRCGRLAYLLRVLRDSDIAIIGGYDRWEYWLALLFGRSRVLHYGSTLTSHSAGVRGVAGRILRRAALRRAHQIWTYGRAATESAVAHGAARGSIVTGFNVSRIAGSSISSLPQVDESDSTLFRILFVGQLIPRKNPVMLVKALALTSGTHLTIVGAGPASLDISREISSLGLERRVTLTEHVAPSQLAAIYDAHDLLVLPSSEEVWGLVVNEALERGLRVAVSANAGVAMDVSDWTGVTIIDDISPRGIAKSIIVASQTSPHEGEIRQHTYDTAALSLDGACRAAKERSAAP